ncbi:MAG: site-2 protease family protein [Oscillospiraceae bacterium]|nr:site-2 protease family protein [Oscillospiraceae bacterium]
MEIFTYRPVFRLFDWIASPSQANAIALLISCFSVGVMIFVVFPLREYARGLTAKFLGDDTPERHGRLTLNPFAHIELLGALIMLIAPIGWSKPMEFNISRCRKVNAKTALVLTSLAGPMANILISYIVLVIAKLIAFNINMSSQTLYYFLLSFNLIIQLNVFIAVLNLLPVPPYDGSKILFSFLKPRTVIKIMQYHQIITLVFIVLLFMRNSPIRLIIEIVSNYILMALDFLSGFIR